MSTSRRDFIRNAALAGTALGTAGTSIPTGSQAAQQELLPTAKSSELLRILNLKFPIFQAPHPGAGPDLVAAVSNVGAMGILGGLNRLTPDAVFEYVKATRHLTKRLFAANYLLAFDSRSLPNALEAGAPVLHFSWGLPTRDMVTRVRRAAAMFGVQVANAAGARAALDLGANYLVCQGIEAGGHVQSSTALYEAMPAILNEARTLLYSPPVVSATGDT